MKKGLLVLIALPTLIHSMNTPSTSEKQNEVYIELSHIITPRTPIRNDKKESDDTSPKKSILKRIAPSKKTCCRSIKYLAGVAAIGTLAAAGYYLWYGCSTVKDGCDDTKTACNDMKTACGEMQTACNDCVAQFDLLKSIIKHAIDITPDLLDKLKSSYDTIRESEMVNQIEQKTQETADNVTDFFNDLQSHANNVRPSL